MSAHTASDDDVDEYNVAEYPYMNVLVINAE